MCQCAIDKISRGKRDTGRWRQSPPGLLPARRGVDMEHVRYVRMDAHAVQYIHAVHSNLPASIAVPCACGCSPAATPSRTKPTRTLQDPGRQVGNDCREGRGRRQYVGGGGGSPATVNVLTRADGCAYTPGGPDPCRRVCLHPGRPANQRAAPRPSGTAGACQPRATPLPTCRVSLQVHLQPH